VSFRFLRSLLCSVGLSTCTGLVCAQTNWAAIPSGTSRNLWGLCYGGGQFVAVGEGGTILTSPDGLTWVSRTSGTNVWLTAVCHGLGNYLAVGEGGVVLASYDGITWSRVPSDGTTVPTTERLNVAAYIPQYQQFIALGERSAAEIISLPRRIMWKWNGDDRLPRTWWRSFALGVDHHAVVGGETGLLVFANGVFFPTSPLSIRVPEGLRNVSGIVFDRGAFTAVGGAGAIVTSTDAINWSPEASGTTANLNGLTAFNNTLLAVGEGGTILSQDARNAWQRRTSPSTELLLGVAASDTAAVIVGGGGTILRATPSLMPPMILGSPASLVETRGGVASFQVRASGSLPLTYQWSRDGVELAGETRATLTRASLGPSDGGAYSVRVSNPAGSVVSGSAQLTLLPPPPLVVDETFQADPSIDDLPAALLTLTDGAVLVAHGKRNQLLKLRADGSLDPSWARNEFTPTGNVATASFNVLAAQSDGRLLVGGIFSALNGLPRSNLVRLNSDGTLDATFVPAGEATVRPITALSTSPTGQILVANGGVVPIRLLPDGRSDPAFSPTALPPAPTSIAGVLRDYLVWSVDITRDGKTLVAARADTATSSVQRGSAKSVVFRLHANGTRDDSFAEVRWDGSLSGMRAIDDGGVVILPRQVRPSTFPTFTVAAWRFTADGTAYLGHARPDIPDFSATFIYRDGRVIYCTPTGPARLTAMGAIDPAFTGGIGRPAAIAPTLDGRIVAAGSFTLYNGKLVNRVVRLNEVINGAINPPKVLQVSVDRTTVSVGETITARAAVIGSADLTFEWTGGPGYQPVRTNSPVFMFSYSSLEWPRSLRVTVYNPSGQATSLPIDFSVLPGPPRVIGQPNRMSAPAGRDVTLTVNFDSNAGQLEYEWRRNDRDVSPPQWWLNGPSLDLPAVSAGEAGTYTLTVRNVLGEAVTTSPIILTLDDSSRFANLSTRAFVGQGEQALIAGFMVTGSVPRAVLIRGIGPGLEKFGTSGVLPDPQLAVYNDKGVSNPSQVVDNWSADAGSLFSKVGAFPLDAGSKDAALRAVESPGSYTVQLTAKPGQSGNALVEIYEADNVADRMLNLSTRAFIGGAAGPAIAGFSIVGAVPKRVLIRVAGPALRGFGVANAVSDPRLELRDRDSAVVATNDNWDDAAAAMAMRAVGAFPFETGSRDAVLLMNLVPGNYTAIADGVAGTTGIALIEVYDVP
jgi:uncharacterized delta-60 repeat protein